MNDCDFFLKMLTVKCHRNIKLMICTCLVSFNQYIIGATFTFSSILLAKLNEKESPITINSDDASWIASIPVLFCPIGLIIIGLLTDKIGRIKALQIAYIPLIISWLVIACAGSLKTIIIGRIIMGITFGSGTCAYLYMAEVSPTDHRPLCFSMVAVFVGLGMMSVCVLSMFFHWQTVSAILFAKSAVGCVSLFALPESPLWLRANGRPQDASAAEQWLYVDQTATAAAAAAAAAAAVVTGDDDDDDDDDVADRRRGGGLRSYAARFVRPTVWKPTLIALAFFVCQQCSGFYVLLYYSVDVLRDCRVRWDGVHVTLYLSAARVVGSLVYSSLHHVRRKTITAVSSSGMTVSLVAIVAYMKAYSGVDDPPYAMFPIVAFVMYVFFAMLAILPLPWAICGELFPISVKGIMTGVVQVCGYELMFVVIKVYPSMVSTYGIQEVWSVFAGFCVLSLLYGAYIMPETKGKSLDEILESFESRKIII